MTTEYIYKKKNNTKINSRNYQTKNVISFCINCWRENTRRSFPVHETRRRYNYSAFVRWLYLLSSRVTGSRAAFAGSRPWIVDPAKIVASTTWCALTMVDQPIFLSLFSVIFIRKTRRLRYLRYCTRAIIFSFYFPLKQAYQFRFLYVHSIFSFHYFPLPHFPKKKTPRCKRFRRGLFLNKKKKMI